METFRLLPIDRNSPEFKAYNKAFTEFCKYEEGTQPKELKERVTRTYKAWVASIRREKDAS